MTQQPTPVLSAGMADALAARRNSGPDHSLQAGPSPSSGRLDTPQRLSSAATSPARASLTLDRDGRPIRELDSVPVDLLQSLYLSPTATTSTGVQTPPGSRPTTPSRPDSVQPSPSQHLSVRARTRSNDSTTSERYSHHNFPMYDWPKSVQFSSKTVFPPVKKLGVKDRKRILVTGGAGFVGSHLVDRLMCMGHDVVVLDNFFSGSKLAISHWGEREFEIQV
ncbi:hypothetical protein ACM66B_004891 [Microbotryomycetes sp. NB124-2]